MLVSKHYEFISGIPFGQVPHTHLKMDVSFHVWPYVSKIVLYFVMCGRENINVIRQTHQIQNLQNVYFDVLESICCVYFHWSRIGHAVVQLFNYIVYAPFIRSSKSNIMSVGICVCKSCACISIELN